MSLRQIQLYTHDRIIYPDNFWLKSKTSNVSAAHPVFRHQFPQTAMTCAVRCGWCRFCVCGSVRLWELARSTRLRLCGMYVFYSSKAGCVVVARQIRQQCGGGVVVVVERHLRRLRLAGIHVGVGVSVGVSRHRLTVLCAGGGGGGGGGAALRASIRGSVIARPLLRIRGRPSLRGEHLARRDHNAGFLPVVSSSRPIRSIERQATTCWCREPCARRNSSRASRC
jgi:hypothetical protein